MQALSLSWGAYEILPDRAHTVKVTILIFKLSPDPPIDSPTIRDAPAREQDGISNKMSKGQGATVNQMVKLIVGAGQASPSPPVGPALGSKGIKSMDFCKV